LLGIIAERIYLQFEIGSQYYYLFEKVNFNPKEWKCNLLHRNQIGLHKRS